ncbi:MAG TPA: Na+/H+ antiporter NhaA [Candidatus Krumholzibacteria bacterium]|nr:Na+/H+ antiporter NhaA [Candidatus Krumholzibacteria bacterium]HPD70776.1 Na+/H+ antiporter NhaA [Candidatus Krumholzibacteria bacterium]HRY39524.1 Na+/H+ antiporter NhaA [Candidatus Krumholzibacteria bacterium]
MDQRDRSGRIPGFFLDFVRSEVSGSVVLLACTAFALALANSPWRSWYDDLAHTPLGVSWGSAAFTLSLQHWVNDLLMVLFFFVVGLEIKREVLVGELSSVEKATLPVAAALGGMVVPAALYTLLNAGGPGAPGWGVPMATDIAFALGILAMLGRRAPLGLKVFLTALAIADDLGAVLVIALFYTEQIAVVALLVAAALLGLLLLAARAGVRRPEVYVALGLGVWAAVLASGVHATVAGVLVALTVPVRARRDPAEFRATSAAALAELERGDLTRESMLGDDRQLACLEALHDAAGDMVPPGLALEHRLQPVQAWLVLPLFAFFNAGVNLAGGSTAPATVPLGIMLGLVVGKPLGIGLFSWLAVRSRRGRLPDGVSWIQLWGAGALAGVGFTMSLFISELAFADADLVAGAKLGILGASLTAGIVGWSLIRLAGRRA